MRFYNEDDEDDDIDQDDPEETEDEDDEEDTLKELDVDYNGHVIEGRRPERRSRDDEYEDESFE